MKTGLAVVAHHDWQFAASPLSASHGKCRGADVAHAPSKTHLAADEGGPDGIVVFIPIFTRRAGVATLVRAASAISTNLPANRRKHAGGHEPYAMLNRRAGGAGGARTRACRVGTRADTRSFRNPEASARMPKRHARVLAPRRTPCILEGLRRGWWKVRARHLQATAVCLLVVLAIFTCGCAVTASVGSSNSNGGELRFAIRADPKSLDPQVVIDEPSQVVQYLTAGVLIRQNRSTQELEPALATQWTVSPDGTSIHFSLRPGIKFSDGTPFSAADVVFTMNRLQDPSLHSPIVETLRTGSGSIRTEAQSPTEVTVRVPARVANLPGQFDQISILSSKARTKTATLGPFEIAEYRAGAYVRVRRNPFYWKKDAAGKSLPYLDSVRLDVQSNREVELMRFRRGDLQLVNGLDAENFERLSAEMPGSVRDLGPSLDSEQFWFNQVPAAPIPGHERQWFRDTQFRRAISLAINRDDICRLVYRGHATPAASSVSPANRRWVNASLRSQAFSREGALDLLTKAGFNLRGGTLFDRAGHPVEFSVITNAGSKTRERMATLIQQDLAKIGIRLNIVPLDFPSLIERITRTFDYEACLLGQIAELDPNEMMNVWRSSAPNHQWNPNQAKPATAWEAEMDGLMLRQAGATDPVKRKAAYDRVQEIVAEQLPFIYLVHKDALVAVSARVGNARPVTLAPQTFWNVDTLTLSASAGR